MPGSRGCGWLQLVTIGGNINCKYMELLKNNEILSLEKKKNLARA